MPFQAAIVLNVVSGSERRWDNNEAKYLPPYVKNVAKIIWIYKYELSG
jgi:hypothetical protein